MSLPKIIKSPSKGGLKRTTLSALALAVSLSGTASAYEFDKPVENVLKFGQADGKYGAIKFDINYRFEYADIKATNPKPGIGNTLRGRFGYLTPKFFGLQAYAEYEGNWAMQEDYNSLRNGNTGNHVIADPQESELNRLWLSFDLIPDTKVKGGRQRIKIDDSRFIGNVGWRQMEQTYDAVDVINKSIPNLTLRAGYIGRVQTILSTLDDMTSAYGHFNYNMGILGKFIGYGYWLDYDKEKFRLSSQTYGFRMLGSPKVNDTYTAHYLLEWSRQDSYGDNPIDYSLDRWHINGGLTVKGITVKGGFEQLGGNGSIAFSTPLGTNHAFQGWADKFLNPALYKDGLRDVYASIGTKVYGTKLAFIYHNFRDDTGQNRIGNEYNFLAVKKFGKHYSILAKYAYYVDDGYLAATGNAFFNDTHKVWVQGNVRF